MKPQIIDNDGEDIGKYNANLKESIEKIDKSNMYRDLSTIIICPTRGMFPTRVVQSWMKLQKPLNQQVYGPIFAESMKVDAAYNSLIEYILGSELLNKCKYILTIEEDNLPPTDGLLRLYENIEKYDAVSGLYWGKGKEGFPMIFGDPEKNSKDNTPQVPKYGEIQRANALGMGFTLFKLDMFKKIDGPWFKTLEGVSDKGIPQKVTQDFYFYMKAGKQGYKFAVDNRVLVGHYDHRTNIVY